MPLNKWRENSVGLFEISALVSSQEHGVSVSGQNCSQNTNYDLGCHFWLCNFQVYSTVIRHLSTLITITSLVSILYPPLCPLPLVTTNLISVAMSLFSLSFVCSLVLVCLHFTLWVESFHICLSPSDILHSTILSRSIHVFILINGKTAFFLRVSTVPLPPLPSSGIIDRQCDINLRPYTIMTQ